jgi:hypothetical protein
MPVTTSSSGEGSSLEMRRRSSSSEHGFSILLLDVREIIRKEK